MKYPCDGCLVDMMCRDPCTDLIFFTDELNSRTLVYEFINSSERTHRMDVCILNYASGGKPRITKLYSRITNILREKKLQKWRNGE